MYFWNLNLWHVAASLQVEDDGIGRSLSFPATAEDEASAAADHLLRSEVGRQSRADRLPADVARRDGDVKEGPVLQPDPNLGRLDAEGLKRCIVINRSSSNIF